MGYIPNGAPSNIPPNQAYYAQQAQQADPQQAQQQGNMQLQMFGDDLYAPGYRLQRADGSWVQKGSDGKWHPYVKFGGETDEQGNFHADGTMETSPSDAKDPNKMLFTQGFNQQTVQPDSTETKARVRRGDMPHPWWLSNPFGREPTANYKEDFANNYDKSAANQQLVGQRYWQEANKDFRNEQAKNDQTQANTRFTESQQQMNGSDNTSLIGRELVSNDPTQREQWQAAQVANAKQAQEAEINDRNSAVHWRKTGAEDQYRYRQNAMYDLASARLSMGPREDTGEKEEEGEEKKQPEAQQQSNEQPQQRSYYDDVSVQDVLNYLTQIHWKEVSAALGLGEGEHVTDWWKKSHESGHTVANNPDLDTDGYKQAVEEIGNKLWSGQRVMVGGKDVGGTGEKGVEAYNLLHGVERGGTEHGAENWQNKEHHDRVTEASKTTVSTSPSSSTINNSSQTIPGYLMNSNIQLGSDGMFHFGGS